MRRQTLQRLGVLFVALLAWSGVASAQHWLPVPKGGFNAGGVALQLTDGTIMVQEYGSPNWYQLTPDEHADYTNGTWTKLASSLVSDGESGYVTYAPQDVASAVLPDGRVIVEGGEYNWVGGQYNSAGSWVPGTAKKVWTNLGAIFDLTKGYHGLWTRVYPPKGWTQIGDAPSVVLPNGTFMLGQCCFKPPQTPQAALLDVDGNNLSWTVLTSTNGYKGKYDSNNEEGWTLLPNGNVLTVDTYINAPGKGKEGAKKTLPNNSEIFTPGTNPPLTGTWTSAGNTVEPLSNLQVICDPPVKGGHEVGPGILRPDGTVFVAGVNACKGGVLSGPGHTAIYYPNSEGGFWKAGPDIPCSFFGCGSMYDAPAALLQDGNVLVQTSPGANTAPSVFYEFDLKTNTFLSGIPFPPNFSQSSSEPGRMLVVASGHVFYMHLGKSTDEMGFYVPQGTYDPLWEPIVTSVTDNGHCAGCIYKGYTGNTYTVSGTQLNGLSQGAGYGDDGQSATNYPLVLIENCKSGHKFFARTHDFSTMGVATGFFNIVSAKFDVTPNIELGPSNLTVIANGIPSQPYGGSDQKCGSFIDVKPQPVGN